MKPTTTLTFLFLTLTLCGSHVALSQEPSPPQEMQISSGPGESAVYLKKDYVDAMTGSKIFSGSQLSGVVFERFDNEFAVFKRKDSKHLIYIPKTAILYIEAGEKALRY